MVRRLREAGAIVVGKTLLPELAICGFTESATWGVTRNPWDPQRTPGGSSGGSAAAVAAGLVPIASASDGAGSIRIPAACCGLFGLKPQRGRVSLAPDLEHWNGLSVNGCVSRTVLDTALWLDVVSGGSEEPGAPAAARAPLRRVGEDAARQAAGRLLDRGAAGARRRRPSPTVAKGAVAETAELLRSLGHEVARPATPTGAAIGNNVDAALPARRSPKTSPRCRSPSGSNAAPAASAQARPADPRPPLRTGAARARRGRRRPRQRDLRLLRRADDAGDGWHGAAGAPLGGTRGALDRCSG